MSRDSALGHSPNSRLSDIVQILLQMSESLLASLDRLSEMIFGSPHCTVMHSDAIVFVSPIDQISISVRLVRLILPLKYLFTKANQS